MRGLDGLTYSMDMSFEQALGFGDGQGKPGMLQSMELQRIGHEAMDGSKSGKE